MWTNTVLRMRSMEERNMLKKTCRVLMVLAVLACVGMTAIFAERGGSTPEWILCFAAEALLLLGVALFEAKGKRGLAAVFAVVIVIILIGQISMFAEENSYSERYDYRMKRTVRTFDDGLFAGFMTIGFFGALIVLVMYLTFIYRKLPGVIWAIIAVLPCAFFFIGLLVVIDENGFHSRATLALLILESLLCANELLFISICPSKEERARSKAEWLALQEARRQKQREMLDSIRNNRAGINAKLGFLYTGSIAAMFLFNMLTLGIYGMLWTWRMIKNHHTINDEFKGCLGEWLMLMFVPLYSVYWADWRGRTLVRAAHDKGYIVQDRGVAHLMLALVGLNVINLALMQENFNALADGTCPMVETPVPEKKPEETPAPVQEPEPAQAPEPAQEPAPAQEPVLTGLAALLKKPE